MNLMLLWIVGVVTGVDVVCEMHGHGTDFDWASKSSVRSVCKWASRANLNLLKAPGKYVFADL